MTLITVTYDLRGQLQESPIKAVFTAYSRDSGGIQPDFIPANKLTVTYADTVHNFEGGQIRSTDSIVGLLTTVSLDVVVDLQTTYLSLLLPETHRLPKDGDNVNLQVAAISSVIDTRFTRPDDEPNRTSYTAFNLNGTVKEQ